MAKESVFLAMPYEIRDLSSISMTFYRMDQSFYKLLEEIPEEVFEVSAIIVKKAQMTLDCSLNPNLCLDLRIIFILH